ncbi:MAG: hypothetical protein K2X27_26865 [Candidatus Obscuribacterales bacterium]|nr:hypothetical protein [Candidatus Obscuribacterales bacterium]
MQSKSKKRNSRQRSKAGLTLAGTAAGMLTFTIVFVLITVLGVNSYAYVEYSQKLQTVAEEVAKRVNGQNYFLGAKRPKFQTSGTKAEKTAALAATTAKAFATAMGIPSSADIEVEIKSADADLTKVEITATNVPLPYDLAGVLPKIVELKATGVSTDASEAPPAFIRLGFKLIDPSSSNPAVTDATQVVMLPAYGFQTDFGGVQNLGGTQNNNDVVGNQPNAEKCLWAGVNASPDPLRSNAPYISGPNNQQILTFN